MRIMYKNGLIITKFCVGVAVLLSFISMAEAQSNDMDMMFESTLQEIEDASPRVSQRKSLSSDTILNNLQFAETDIHVVLEEITAKTGVVFLKDDDITGEVTIYLNDVYVEDALRIILDSIALAYKEEPEGMRIMTAASFRSRYGYAFDQLVHTKIIPLLHADLEETAEKLGRLKSSIGKILKNQETNTIIILDSPN